MPETEIMKAAQAAIKKHGTIKKAGDALGIEQAYLFRLSTGEKSNPSDEIAEKLGLRRRWGKIRA